MIYAEKGNKVIQIEDIDVARYKSLGYDIKDDNGSLIERGTPTDIQSYQVECARLKTEIEALKSIIESKDVEIKTLKSAKTTTKKKKVEEE